MLQNPRLQNLRLLKKDMQSNDWIISSFMFRYKEVSYIVLVHLFGKNLRKKDKYALVCLIFLSQNDLDHSLKVEANANSLLIDPKSLREYFGIEYSKNLGDILSQFTSKLNTYIPIKVPELYSNEQKEVMVSSLSESDSEDPNRKYCFAIKRNAKGARRSEFNANKAHLLRPTLFERYKDDTSISFCFSDDKKDERTNFEIMRSFSQNN